MGSIFWETLISARDLGRLHNIASILILYGFSDMVRRLGMANVLERVGYVLHWQETVELAQLEPPARVRRALEEMGPTFIKLGQILATRMDLFSPEWITEFEKLQDRALSVPFSEIRQQLQEDLGAAPEEVFAKLVPEPLAAASIAQVHSARLHNGDEVIVKVRRPGIRPIVEADLRLLQHLAKIVEAESPEMSKYRPREVVRQFTLSLRRELDLAEECRNSERIARNFSARSDIVIPKVYWTWTGERVNVQEAVNGISGHDLEGAERAGLDLKLLARRGASAVLKMILEDGFFHADPHQGNIFYLPENRIAIIDFGMVGHLSSERRGQVVDLLHGLVERDSDRVVEVLFDWAGDANIDQNSLKLEIDGLVDHYHGVPLKELNISTILSDLTTLLRDYHLALPPDLTLLIKSLITLEGMGRQLDPEFDMVTEFSPFLHQALRARYAPDALIKRGWQAVVGGLDILTELPKDLHHLLRSARSGRLQVHVDVTHLKYFGNQLDRATSRLTMGVVIAALIIGSSIVMTVDRGPVLFGLPLIGLLGFLGAAVTGVWLLISIRRSGKNIE